MFRSRRYRVDNEQLVLVLTVLLVLVVIVLTSTVTFCVSGIFILGMFVISAFTINTHHRALMHSALPVNEIQSPSWMPLCGAVRKAAARCDRCLPGQEKPIERLHFWDQRTQSLGALYANGSGDGPGSFLRDRP